jgi:hypothetical protein
VKKELQEFRSCRSYRMERMRSAKLRFLPWIEPKCFALHNYRQKEYPQIHSVTPVTPFMLHCSPIT